jgi:hypothetical protein
VNFRGEWSANEGSCRDAEQVEGLKLDVGELRREGLDGFVVAEQRVTLGEAE